MLVDKFLNYKIGQAIVLLIGLASLALAQGRGVHFENVAQIFHGGSALDKSVPYGGVRVEFACNRVQLLG